MRDHVLVVVAQGIPTGRMEDLHGGGAVVMSWVKQWGDQDVGND